MTMNLYSTNNDSILGKILRCELELEECEENVKQQLRSVNLIVSACDYNQIRKNYSLKCYNLNDNKTHTEVISSDVFDALCSESKYSNTLGDKIKRINICYEII